MKWPWAKTGKWHLVDECEKPEEEISNMAAEMYAPDGKKPSTSRELNSYQTEGNEH